MNLTEQHALALADNIPARLLTGMAAMGWGLTPSDLDGLVGACLREMVELGLEPLIDCNEDPGHDGETPYYIVLRGHKKPFVGPTLAHAVAESVEAMAAKRSKA